MVFSCQMPVASSQQRRPDASGEQPPHFFRRRVTARLFSQSLELRAEAICNKLLEYENNEGRRERVVFFFRNLRRLSISVLSAVCAHVTFPS